MLVLEHTHAGGGTCAFVHARVCVCCRQRVSKRDGVCAGRKAEQRSKNEKGERKWRGRKTVISITRRRNLREKEGCRLLNMAEAGRKQTVDVQLQ